jgi:hypothetical protein
MQRIQLHEFYKKKMRRNCNANALNFSYNFVGHATLHTTMIHGVSRKVTQETMPLTWQIMDETTVNLLNFNNLQG